HASAARTSFSRIKEPVLRILNPAAKEFLMTARILSALCFSLALSGAHAQTTPPETSPDQQAWTEAGKIVDPEKKIAALEKIKVDFPNSRYAAISDTLILNTLIQKLPEQTDRVRKAAKAVFANS